MNEIDNMQKMTFKDYYLELEITERKLIRDRFLQASGISYPTFYSKMVRGNFALLEQKAIEDICQKSFNW